MATKSAAKKSTLTGKRAIEDLKETATGLKKKKVGLEQEVKLISYQVQRLVEQLKGDYYMRGKSAGFEK